MGAWLRRRKKHRQRMREMRDRLQEQRDNATEQRKTAKLSKRQAKKLNKIYGDLNPEEVNQVNEIQPYVGGMAQQLEENGVPVENSDDPIEVASKYNTEILDEPAPEGYEAFDEGYEGWDKEKAKTALKTVFGGIVGAFTARKKIADERAMKGEPLNKADKALIQVAEVKNDIVKDEKKKEISSIVKKWLPIAGLALVAYLIFKD